MVMIMIDLPSPYAPVSVWEATLVEVNSFPECEDKREALVRIKEMIARKKNSENKVSKTRTMSMK